jgi:hypothetical protein
MVCRHREAVPLRTMSRRIDIELTSALGDGTWTWRAAGARQPKGVLDGSILPGGSKVGDELKVEVEQEIDGITVLSVVHGREKQGRSLMELLPVEREFQPVVETRAKRDPNDRPRRDRGERGDRRPRRDGDSRGRGDGRGDGERRGRDGDNSGRGDGRGRGDGDRRGRDGGRRGPSFTPPPEVPQRPKPKRLRPGKTNRTAVLADLPAEQRPIAELALQGMGAVRQRLREENDKAVAEGRAAMPEATVLKMAEELLPRLRVAEWRDRAEAAKSQADELDLRDLRSVVAAGDDPIVVRDETTRALNEELKHLLVHKQEQELSMWFADMDAALAVGRVIRALRLSSQPPKAGVPFPTDIAQRLADSANAALAPMDAPDRWAAMLEAAAFSPIRTLVKPLRKPDVVNDELTATVTRLAPALPHVAELFGIEVAPNAPMPKPLRPSPRPGAKGGKPGDDRPKRGDRPERAERGPRPPKSGDAAKPSAADAGPTAAVNAPTDDATPVEEALEAVEASVAVEAPVIAEETPEVEAPVIAEETPEVETPVIAEETPAADEAPVIAEETPEVETPVIAEETPAADEAPAAAADAAADGPADSAEPA